MSKAEDPEVKAARKAARKQATLANQAAKKASKPVKRTSRARRDSTERAQEELETKYAGGSRTSYPWEEILDTYLNTVENITLRELSRRYNVPYQSLINRASKDRWQILRQTRRIELLEKRRKEHLEFQVDEGVKFDKLSTDAAKVGMGLVTGRLVQMQQLFLARRQAYDAAIEGLKRGEAVAKEDLYSTINWRELESLARTMEAFQNVGRRALGLDSIDMNLNLSGSVSQETVVNIGAELGKDDPQRLAAMLEAMERSGLLNLQLPQEIESGVVEAEIVEDEEDG